MLLVVVWIILVTIEAEDILIIAGWHVREKSDCCSEVQCILDVEQCEMLDNVITIPDCVGLTHRMQHSNQTWFKHAPTNNLGTWDIQIAYKGVPMIMSVCKMETFNLCMETFLLMFNQRWNCYGSNAIHFQRLNIKTNGLIITQNILQHPPCQNIFLNQGVL